MMRTLISQNRQPDLGMMVQYAAILLKTRQDAELAAQMRHLYTQPLNAQPKRQEQRGAHKQAERDAEPDARGRLLLPLGVHDRSRADHHSDRSRPTRYGAPARRPRRRLAWVEVEPRHDRRAQGPSEHVGALPSRDRVTCGFFENVADP